MKHDDLFLCLHIFSSDDDAEVVEDILTGYDESLNLILLLLHTDYVEPENNHQTYATINKDEAYKFAKRLHVPMCRLPNVIAEYASEYGRLVNPTLSQTRDCFTDILKFATDKGCKLRLH